MAGTVAPCERNVGCCAGPGLRSSSASSEPRSCPAEKFLPRPARITTRTASSASARPNASSSCTNKVRDWAFWASGLLSQIRAIRPSSSVSYVTCWGASPPTGSALVRSGLATADHLVRLENYGRIAHYGAAASVADAVPQPPDSKLPEMAHTHHFLTDRTAFSRYSA